LTHLKASTETEQHNTEKDAGTDVAQQAGFKPAITVIERLKNICVSEHAAIDISRSKY
jgi:hypothetical protein